MHIFVPKETAPGETRAAATPDAVARLVKLGANVSVETGLGAASGFPDDLYVQAGASVNDDRAVLLAGADAVIRVRKPPLN
ncbi:MAG TPA: NAD(P)(+) transhydrogenase (Re/Si-specific) subunit alpha, partial [Candidatus Hydrogenedentes bacterium]|nr:NAD(P)(+) transhydrogenase (Re/Si-specific) subunit alpha [Candidatus Hydrogenedentota bacterium]